MHCYVSLQQWLCKRTTMLLYPYKPVSQIYTRERTVTSPCNNGYANTQQCHFIHTNLYLKKYTRERIVTSPCNNGYANAQKCFFIHKNLYPQKTQENALLRLLATMVMQTHNNVTLSLRGGADKSLVRPGRKQAVLLGKKENKI